MESEEAKENAIDLAKKGLEFFDIKKELIERGFDDSDIKIALKDIDDYIVAYQLNEQTKSRHITQMMIGAFSFILAFGLNIFTIFSIGRHSMWLYAVAIGGLWFVWDGYGKYRMPQEDRIIEKSIGYKSKFRR